MQHGQSLRAVPISVIQVVMAVWFVWVVPIVMMLTISQSLTSQHVALSAAAVGLVTLVVLLFSRRPLVGTTLTASWNWSLLSVAALTGCEVVAAGCSAETNHAPQWLAPLRFVALSSTFCPMMALLGARRPQNREWKYIVLCLWIVLALPACWALFLRPGRFSLEPVWAFFLVGLVVLGVCNYLPTRYWPSSLLYGAGQVLLLANYLPWFSGMSGNWDAGTNTLTSSTIMPLAGQGCLAGALGLVHFVAHRRRRVPSVYQNPLDRLWNDFRDSFGAVWALRVAQRTNAASIMYNWETVLCWDGFHRNKSSQTWASPVDADELPLETVRAVERNFRSLLRRFVSSDWIDQRLPA